MEPIDVAAERLNDLISEIAGYKNTIISEEDTRLKVLNPVLTKVLGWPMQEISTEERSGKSGFIDYKLTVDGLARLVVEAKRDGRELGLETHTAGRAYKLSGPVFNTSSVTEGIEQAIRYCGQKNAELACVTNGREWVVFRGSRIGDGRDTMEGYGFAFPSLDTVQANFALFYDLLSFERVAEFHYRAHFQEVEGRPIRAHTSRTTLRNQNTKAVVNEVGPPRFVCLQALRGRLRNARHAHPRLGKEQRSSIIAHRYRQWTPGSPTTASYTSQPRTWTRRRGR